MSFFLYKAAKLIPTTALNGNPAAHSSPSTVTVVTSRPLTAALYAFTNMDDWNYGVWVVSEEFILRSPTSLRSDELCVTVIVVQEWGISKTRMIEGYYK